MKKATATICFLFFITVLSFAKPAWHVEFSNGTQWGLGVINCFPQNQKGFSIGVNILDAKITSPWGFSAGLGYILDAAIGNTYPIVYGEQYAVKASLGYQWFFWDDLGDIAIEALPSIGLSPGLKESQTFIWQSINGPALGLDLRGTIGCRIWGPLGFRAGPFLTYKNYSAYNIEYAGMGLNLAVFTRFAW